MTQYRRRYRPGASYFFTLCLAQPGARLLLDHADALRAAYVATWLEQPFVCAAMVILPDHLHMVWTLPAGDADFSTRLRLIKARFSRAIDADDPRPAVGGPVPPPGRRAGVWQRRFWEHCLRDAADLDWHLRYCWSDPVRHGVAAQAEDWPLSSLQRDLRRGLVRDTRPPPAPPRFTGEPRPAMANIHRANICQAHPYQTCEA